jgi:excisionase family DNA binding protein
LEDARPSRLLTIEEVARFLNISRAQGYLAVRAEGFPLIELGPRLLRVDPRQLHQWLDKKLPSFQR